MRPGFQARNHPQQPHEPTVDDRAVPFEVFEPLQERFGFTIDVAATSLNARLERFYTEADDALSKSWSGERVWCNPPYSNIEPWVLKAWQEWRSSTPAELIVMMLPANRTEQPWWQDWIEPHRGGLELEVEFLAGRIRFLKPEEESAPTQLALIGPEGAKAFPNSRPSFGSCLAIWSRR